MLVSSINVSPALLDGDDNKVFSVHCVLQGSVKKSAGNIAQKGAEGYNGAMKKYTGGCHCGAVEYEVEMDLEDTLVCDCSHCGMKGFIMRFVPKESFKLLKGEDNLTSYKFAKGAINHLFCKTCGVESFSTSDVYPKMMVNVRCLKDVDISTLSPKQFNGKGS